MASSTCEDTSPDDDSSNDESLPADPLDFAAVLSAFIANSNPLMNSNTINGHTRSNRKRSAVSYDGAVAKRRMGWQDGHHIEVNNESGAFDTSMFFENGEDVACASGLVDSKAKNKVTCVPATCRCPECDYLNSNSVWEAKKHCTSQHGRGVEPISNEEKHKALILMWNKRCFPDWKQKRPQWWSADENSITAPAATKTTTLKNRMTNSRFLRNVKDFKVESDDVTAMIREAILRREPRDSIIRDEDRDDSEPRTPAPEGLHVDDRTCHLCWEESRYPGRHIAQKHLKKPLYECPICEGFPKKSLLLQVHPDCPDAQPLSNLERYADEIRDLQNRCFPNRPMKLVRPKESTRPRERHNCKICGTQVAQSDRQRHVYHRHLQRTRIFECPLCSFASNYDVHRKEIDQLNEDCFPGWQHRRKPFWWLDNDDKRSEMKREELEAEFDTIENTSDSMKESTPSSTSNDLDESIYDDSPDQQSKDHIGQPMKRSDLAWKLLEWIDVHGQTHVEENADTTYSSTVACSEEQFFSTALNGWCRRLVSVRPMTSYLIILAYMSNSIEVSDAGLCLKEFKPTSNFLRHVAKDHLDMPLFQCVMCNWGAADAYEVKAHMVKVHNNADLDPISNLELNPDRVQQRFTECFPSRKMKVVMNAQFQPGTFDKKKDSTTVSDETKVTCQECFQEMKTEDRQIHVYRHHLKEPRLYECPLCDFSHHACSSDVRTHIKFTHRDNSDVMPRANLLQYSQQIAEWNDRCFPGWINRKLPASVMEDFNRCRLCDEDVRQTSRHIAEVHLMIQLHQCPLCEYGAPESRLVKRHLRNNHDELMTDVERSADYVWLRSVVSDV
uniref:C2H2-type domain-containing protein n=1 Tax=Angiostrongylus cantonensis TaxID=6313 RepID=A0A0K0DI51_ANGCA